MSELMVSLLRSLRRGSPAFAGGSAAALRAGQILTGSALLVTLLGITPAHASSVSLAVLGSATAPQSPIPGPRAANPLRRQAARNQSMPSRPRVTLNVRGGFGSITPANGDPRLAALLAQSVPSDSGMRFTPSVTAVRVNRSVTVAVRARPSRAPHNGAVQSVAMAANTTGNQSRIGAAYDLGVSLGWRRFALSSNIASVRGGPIGGRQAVDVGLSYNMRRWSSRLAVGAEKPIAREDAPVGLVGGPAYSVDLGGSYSLVRNVALAAGLRYRTETRRMLDGDDDRHDSEAVYVGTVIRF